MPTLAIPLYNKNGVRIRSNREISIEDGLWRLTFQMEKRGAHTRLARVSCFYRQQDGWEEFFTLDERRYRRLLAGQERIVNPTLFREHVEQAIEQLKRVRLPRLFEGYRRTLLVLVLPEVSHEAPKEEDVQMSGKQQGSQASSQ